MSKITIEQKQAELESNESMVMEYLALFNNGDHIVERKGIDAFHHKPFCCSESTHKENKNIQQGGKKYGDV